LRENPIGKTYQPAAVQIPLDEYRGREGNILVISPHPDDDVLGAGGTMILNCDEGKGVFSVYITDGRGSPRKDPRITDEELATRREKEAMASLRTVGAAGGFFLKRRSQELKGAGGIAVQKELDGILQFLQPTEIYLPAPYERHPTHQICTFLTIEALRSAGGRPIGVFGYSLWGSFWGQKKRTIRDIGSVIGRKAKAVLAHESQIEYKKYHQGILGKNNYEAVFLESHEVQKASFIEIFLDMTEFLSRKDLSMKTFMREDFEEFQTAYTDFSLPG
jgi:LmbE family N-acetylglucosaminyl deacetylase